MRGIATVISVGFISVLLFGIFAPSVLEPIAETVLQDSAVQDSVVDEQGMVDGLLRSLLVWAPLLVLFSGVASAVVWYLRRERHAAARRAP